MQRCSQGTELQVRHIVGQEFLGSCDKVLLDRLSVGEESRHANKNVLGRSKDGLHPPGSKYVKVVPRAQHMAHNRLALVSVVHARFTYTIIIIITIIITYYYYILLLNKMDSLAISSAPQAIACVCVCSKKSETVKTVKNHPEQKKKSGWNWLPGYLCILQYSINIPISSFTSKSLQISSKSPERSGPHPGEIDQFDLCHPLQS